MNRPDLLILSHSEIVSVLSMPIAIEAVRAVMLAHGQGQVIAPNLLHADVPRGEFHIKTGGVLGTGGPGGEGVFGLKANGGFFNNGALGLPNIVGLISLADAKTGVPLAVLDSVEISRVRTGAATAVAAQCLARPDSAVVTVIGSGTQARTQIEALAQVLPLKRVQLVGRNPERAAACAKAIEETCELPVTVFSEPNEPIGLSDVVVTSTTARQPLFAASAVRPGTFIAAVGADSPGKQELDPALVAASKVVADVHGQSTRVGELQHPIGLGLMTAEQVHGELGQLLCGLRPGRTDDYEVTIYDSTGTALQDVAVGLVVYEQALERGFGRSVQLGA